MGEAIEQMLFSDLDAAKHWGAPADAIRALARFRRINYTNLFRSRYARVRFTKGQLDRFPASSIQQACAAVALFNEPTDCIDHLRNKCRGKENGSIYFVGDGSAIKIGFAINIPARIRELQCANPRELAVLGSTSGSVELERVIHGRFKYIRIRGEWFRHTKGLLRWIDAVKAYDLALAVLHG